MIKDRRFEGKITIKKVPQKVSAELVNLATTFSHRAYQKDPLDRLIGVKPIAGGFEVTTTEKQLAVKLAKKIRDVFKKVTMKISYAKSSSEIVFITLELQS